VRQRFISETPLYCTLKPSDSFCAVQPLCGLFSKRRNPRPTASSRHECLATGAMRWQGRVRANRAALSAVARARSMLHRFAPHQFGRRRVVTDARSAELAEDIRIHYKGTAYYTVSDSIAAHSAPVSAIMGLFHMSTSLPSDTSLIAPLG